MLVYERGGVADHADISRSPTLLYSTLLVDLLESSCSAISLSLFLRSE